MAESLNNTTIAQASDPSITDSHGNVWRVALNGELTYNGELDPDRYQVFQVAYVNGRVWRQTPDLLWRSKAHPSEPWLPSGGTPSSPLTGENNQAIGRIQHAIHEVLCEVKEIANAVGQSRTAIIGDVASLLMMAKNQAKQDQAALVVLLQQILGAAGPVATANMTGLLNELIAGQQAMASQLTAITLVQQTEVLPDLQEILADLKALLHPPPVAITTDLDDAGHVPQAIPPRG